MKNERSIKTGIIGLGPRTEVLRDFLLQAPAGIVEAVRCRTQFEERGVPCQLAAAHRDPDGGGTGQPGHFLCSYKLPASQKIMLQQSNLQEPENADRLLHEL